MMFSRAIVSLLPLVPRPMVWRISRRYIAGKNLPAALDRVAELNRLGMSATLDVLGEDSAEAGPAHASRDTYLASLDAIAERGLDCNISVKLSQMGLRFDTELCGRIMDELVVAARRHGNFVRIDMEDSQVTQATLDIYRGLRRSHDNIGAVIQAYLRRSRADVEALLCEGPATHLRICKGIYVEPPHIAFVDRGEVQRSFLELVECALAGGIAKVAIATHDELLVNGARELLERLAVPRERYEFQMLLGVTEGLRDQVVAAGHPLRVYVPFGKAWFAYSYRRLRENPSIAGHIVRNLFTGG